MDDVHDFNSSDIEFDDELKAGQNVRSHGQASIEKMIADAQRDRINSKKTVKQLKQAGLAPSTTAAQMLWIRRFEAYRIHVLHQSADTAFTGDDMIRFFDSIIEKLGLADPHKPGPNLTTIQGAYAILVQYGVFRWASPEFQITAHDAARFKAFVTQALKARRLTKGSWKKRTWVGFVTLSRMIRAYLVHFTENGTYNFDLVLYRCFSVVFIASLGSRSGDVTQSRGYTGGEYMKYEDIELYLPADMGSEPSFSQLRATVTLRYTKGKKTSVNEDLVRYLRPLDDVQQVHMCPIALLLIHALRNGLVHGTTIEEVLNHTMEQPDRHVRWKFPTRPVLTSITRLGTTQCDLDVTTTPSQIYLTIRQMGVISGMLSRVYSHSVRLGAIRDYAHMTKNSQNTFASIDEVRQLAGHTHAAMTRGVTERYTGEMAQEVYNSRADNGGIIHRREPKFAVDTNSLMGINERITADELQSHLDSTKPGTLVAELSRQEKVSARYHIRRDREQHLHKTVQAEPVYQRTASKTSMITAPDMPRVSAENVPRLEPDLGAADVEGSSDLISALPLPENEIAQFSAIDFSAIDPALLAEESLACSDIANSEVEALSTQILGEINDSEEEGSELSMDRPNNDDAMLEESARLVLGSDDYDPNRTASNPADWINSYAKYNVVKSVRFADNWSSYHDDKQPFNDTIGPHCVRGNSRDEPTPFIYVCVRTTGCTYRTVKETHMSRHMVTCTDAAVAAKAARMGSEILTCTHAGCGYQTRNPKTMKDHGRNVHKWIPRQCDQCPEDCAKVYNTAPAYKAHMTARHSGRWPAQCTFPLCQEKKEFRQGSTLTDHLIWKHNLTTEEERRPYMPEMPPKQVWVKQGCFMSSCSSRAQFKRWSDLRNHLTSAHKVTEDMAEELKKRHALSVPDLRSTTKTDCNKRKLSDVGKENISPFQTDAVHHDNQVDESNTKKTKRDNRR